MWIPPINFAARVSTAVMSALLEEVRHSPFPWYIHGAHGAGGLVLLLPQSSTGCHGPAASAAQAFAAPAICM